MVIIIPSVSLGNIPQLAVDLLMHTYGFQLVKTLNDRFSTPFVGPMDYSKKTGPVEGIATACQLFKHGDTYLVQIRSPPLQGYKHEFAAQLKQDLEPYLTEDTRVILLGSALAGVVGSGPLSSISQMETISQPLPESGDLFELASSFPGISSSFVSWVHEGDNKFDAINLARVVIQQLGYEQPTELVEPVSWSKLYGNSAPLGIENGIYS